MLQFINKIRSKEGFVDLHIHTNDSYGEEMDLMNLSPEELLESIYLYTLNNDHCPVTFAVTDHNSIEAVTKIRKIIENDKDKYAHINFISGCEFSCSAGSLGTFTNLNGYRRNIAKNFHMLAYNFDENNEDMQFITKLYSTRRKNTILCNNIYISAGTFVIATQNILKDYGIIVPITKFKGINLETKNIDLQGFVEEIVSYCDKFNVDEKIKEDIKQQLLSRNILHLGKIDCMEIMEIVEKAGGYCVLAHPYIVKLSTWTKNNTAEFESVLNDLLKRNHISTTPNLKNYDKFLKYMIYSLKYNAVSPTTNKKLNGIIGIETLHASVFDRPYCLPNLVKFAKEYKLYMTCGGGSHGNLLKGSVLSRFISTCSCDDYFSNNIVATNCALVDAFKKGITQNNKDCYLDFDHQFRIVKTKADTTELNYDSLRSEIIYRVDRTNRTNKAPIQENMQEILNIIQTGINNIKTVNKALKDLVNNDYSPALAMNKYRELNIYKGAITLALKNTRRHKPMLENNAQATEFLEFFKENKNLTKLFRKKYESVYYGNLGNNEKED